tara:strand:+ start:430 stop:837 length:408 start_codon:yes stop_codon:yes gene_type:complete
MLVVGIPQYVQGLTNAKVDLTTTAVTTVYTAPSNADFNSSIVSSIIVSNDSGSGDTITLTITGDGLSSTGTLTDQAFSLFQVKAVAANTSIELLTRDLVLQSGDILKATAATGGRLHVIASIQEFALHRTPQSAL